jgi:FixJ family two-component response regulator
MKNEQEITVAVVDDDASLCKALRRLLSGWDMQAVTYPSAEAFLEDAHRPPLDCLILDIQLGGMSGFDLREQLRATGCSLPIVFITAQDERETRDRALETGAAYVRKGEPGAALRQAILSAVGRPK